MARTYTPKTNLAKLEFNPTYNPLIEPQEIKTRNRLVTAGQRRELIDSQTGELTNISRIYTIEEKDDAEFVKIFAQGITAGYDLTKTAQRVFQLILEKYEQTPMTGGYADSVEIFWFGDGLEGQDANMSEYTFQRGLRELLDRRFIYPKMPSIYWINPALFFKGDRVQFIKEYRRKNSEKQVTNTTKKAIKP